MTDIESIFKQALAKHREEVAKKQDEAAERRLSATVEAIEATIKSQVATAVCGLEREKRLIAEGCREEESQKKESQESRCSRFWRAINLSPFLLVLPALILLVALLVAGQWGGGILCAILATVVLGVRNTILEELKASRSLPLVGARGNEGD